MDVCVADELEVDEAVDELVEVWVRDADDEDVALAESELDDEEEAEPLGEFEADVVEDADDEWEDVDVELDVADALEELVAV